MNHEPLVKVQVWRDSLKVFVRQFGQRTQVFDGLQANALTTECVDALRLRVAQVGMLL